MAGKKIKGHKRHNVVDSNGFILALDIHAANIHDTIAGPNIIKKALKKYPTLETISTDAG